MIFPHYLTITGFVVLNFTIANLGRLEPKIARFAISEPSTHFTMPHSKRKSQGCRVVSGPLSGRSHSVVPYSGTKCHEVIYTLYYPDNPVTLRTGVHKGSLRGP